MKKRIKTAALLELRTKYQAPSTKYQVTNTKNQTPNTKYQVPRIMSAALLESRTKIAALIEPNTKYQAPNTKNHERCADGIKNNAFYSQIIN